MIRIIAIVIIALATFVQKIFAQTNQSTEVRGIVLDSSKEPLLGASVYLMKDGSQVIVKTGVTNEQGKYSISQIPLGKYYIEVASVGFANGKSAAFEFTGTTVEVPTIELQVNSQSITTVSVTGTPPMIQSKNGKLVFNVENSTIAAGNNALEILKRAPGVTVDKDENILLMGREGINVTIDGRQTFMTGEQLSTFLKSMDGNQIKNIEVSTTRSAKDDAEGATGSINIVLKKTRVEGFNGSFLLSAGHGQYRRGNSSLNLNYKRDNTTLFGTYSYTNDKKLIDLDLLRIVDQTQFDQKAGLLEVDKTHNYRFGIEQKTSSRNTLLAQFSASNNDEDSRNTSNTLMSVPNMALDSTMNTTTRALNGFNRYSFNLNNEFLTDTSGGKLTFDADISKFRNSNDINYEYIIKGPTGSILYTPELERSRMPVDINIYVGKLDYVKPLSSNSRFETGVKYSNVRSDNNLGFEHFVNNQWQDFAGRSNHFIYTEQISAGYLDYSKDLGKWSFKAGLRGEYTVSDGHSVTLGTSVKRDYLDIFPSVNITHIAGENHILSLSYAKKVSRPGYRHLNPFEYYIDRFTFMKGNPYLQPQYTHGLSLNYTLMKMFNFTIGSDITSDAMTESMGQDQETKKSWITRENLGKQVTSYLNVNTPYRVGKVWSMNNNMTFVHMYFKGPIAGFYVDQGTYMFQLNHMSNFKISKSFGAETSIAYTSPFVYNVYQMKSRLGIDMGLSYNFKDQKSSLKLAATDVFRTNKTNINTRFNVFHSDIRQYNDNQTIRLTYSLRFGNLKQSIRKNDANNEERQRAQ